LVSREETKIAVSLEHSGTSGLIEKLISDSLVGPCEIAMRKIWSCEGEKQWDDKKILIDLEGLTRLSQCISSSYS
jgi:hypothetical protein